MLVCGHVQVSGDKEEHLLTWIYSLKPALLFRAQQDELRGLEAKR